MASHPIPAGVRGTCPCCGSPDRFLFTCKRCNWLALPSTERHDAKDRLEQFRSSSGMMAFNRRGCYVCETCALQMPTNPRACPLRLFYEVSTRRQDSSLAGDRPSGDAVGAQWEAWLTERDWPEAQEIHWRRMVDHLLREKRQA
jgi:hypothetical protein